MLKISASARVKDIVRRDPNLQRLIKRMQEPADFAVIRKRIGRPKLRDHKEFPLNVKLPKKNFEPREYGSDEIERYLKNKEMKGEIEFEDIKPLSRYIAGRRTASDLRTSSELLGSQVRGERPLTGKPRRFSDKSWERSGLNREEGLTIAPKKEPKKQGVLSIYRERPVTLDSVDAEKGVSNLAFRRGLSTNATETVKDRVERSMQRIKRYARTESDVQQAKDLREAQRKSQRNVLQFKPRKS